LLLDWVSLETNVAPSVSCTPFDVRRSDNRRKDDYWDLKLRGIDPEAVGC
jgi:hypothetical protein